MLEAKEIVETRIVTWWLCTVQEHRHRTKKVADGCILRAQKHKERPKEKVRRWDDHTEALVIRQRESGMTFKQIGQAWSVSVARARDVYHNALWHQRMTESNNRKWLAWLANTGVREIAESLSSEDGVPG